MTCTCPSGDCPAWERKAGLDPVNAECPQHGEQPVLNPTAEGARIHELLGRIMWRLKTDGWVTTQDWNTAVTNSKGTHTT